MASFTVKNMPDDLYERLKRSADAHRRSINGEILTCLERALAAEPVNPEPLLARLDALRRRVKIPPLTDRSLRSARDSGRP